MIIEMLEFKATMTKVVGNHEFDVYLMVNSLGADPDPKPYWHSTAMSNEKVFMHGIFLVFPMKRLIS